VTFCSKLEVLATLELDLQFRHGAPLKRPIVCDDNEADARIGRHAIAAIKSAVHGDNPLQARRLEVYDPAAAPPPYIPRAFYGRLRAGF